MTRVREWWYAVYMTTTTAPVPNLATLGRTAEHDGNCPCEQCVRLYGPPVDYDE